MSRLFALIFLLPLWAIAQSTLPPCPTDPASRWDRCQGSYRFGDGRVFVGEWANNRPTGWGIEYLANGDVARSGRWYPDALTGGVRALAEVRQLNPAHYPFTSDPLASTVASAADGPGALERDTSAAQGAQPRSRTTPCRSDHAISTWSDCIGAVPAIMGGRFVGVFRNGSRLGAGIEYDSSGRVFRSGDWDGWRLVREYPIRDSRYAFQVPPSTVSGTAVEREQLIAEVQAERMKRQALEEELERRKLTEARERDRPSPSAQSMYRTEKRVALVIGNAAYRNAPLANPVNDAVDVASSLRTMGFETTLVRDATLAQMRSATRQFAEAAALSDVALIFFAGHGIEAKGRNYAIPVGADIRYEYELEEEAFDAGRWLEMLEGLRKGKRQRVNIVILDACRNNEFARSWRSASRGLARMEAPTGTLVAFATAPGKVAADGMRGQRNSPFTRNLLRAIQTPDLPIELMFKEVRRMVLEETQSEQVPWDNSSLVGDFAFKRSR